MKHSVWAILLLGLLVGTARAQDMALTAEENAAVAAILDKAQTSQKPQDHLSAPQNAQDEVKEELDAQDPPIELDEATRQKCLTVAFIDIDEAFNAHPRTIAVKEQIRLKILSKEDEVDSAKELIATLHEENHRLMGLLRQLKPFYERIVVEPHELAPARLKMQTNWNWATCSTA